MKPGLDSAQVAQAARAVLVLISILMLLGTGSARPMIAEEIHLPIAESEQLEEVHLTQLDEVNACQCHVSRRVSTKQYRFVGADPSHPIHTQFAVQPNVTAGDIARAYMALGDLLFGLNDPVRELTVQWQQTADGIADRAGLVVVQLDAPKNITPIENAISPDSSVETLSEIPILALQSTLNSFVIKYQMRVNRLNAAQAQLLIGGRLRLEPV